MDRVSHVVGMDLGQRKYAVVHCLSMGKFLGENFNFPAEGSFLQSTIIYCNTYQYLGIQQLFKVDLRNGHYRGGAFRMGHNSCTPEFQT